MFRSPSIIALAFVLAAATATAAAKPLKVYILAGQSNMQGHADIRTFDVIGLDPETAPMLAAMVDGQGDPIVCEDVWISSLGSADEVKTGRLTAGYGAGGRGVKIGPEFTFGIYMQKQVGEPILIIKTAWGGKSINTDFRPPSAGAYEFNQEQLANFEKQGKDIDAIKAEKAEATGHYYRLMIEHVEAVLADIGAVVPGYDAEAGHELAGFVWFQGWNDMVDGGTYQGRGNPGSYDAYSEVLAHFIRDVRKDLDAPGLPFVIGVMGAGGPIDAYPPEKRRYAGIHGEFRNAMAAPAELPEFRGNVVAVRTEDYWDLELEALRAKERGIAQEVKKLVEAGEVEKSAEREEVEKRKAAAFDEREQRILANGASNAEYHYLGSAKILGSIGKAFAEALGTMAGE